MTTETQAPDPAPVPAGFALIPLESSDALLRPFYECPPEELKLAWQAMHMIAKKMHPAPAIPAPDADYVRRLAEDWAADCVKAGYVTTGAASHKVMAEAINALAIPAPEGALRAAANAVLTRWNSPLWRQEVGTAELMAKLRAALAAPAPQAPVALPDVDLCRLISSHEVHQYHPGALHEFSHSVIAEFCRVNGIPAPQTKEQP